LNSTFDCLHIGLDEEAEGGHPLTFKEFVIRVMEVSGMTICQPSEAARKVGT
jgi:hypothetical protein